MIREYIITIKKSVRITAINDEDAIELAHYLFDSEDIISIKEVI